MELHVRLKNCARCSFSASGTLEPRSISSLGTAVLHAATLLVTGRYEARPIHCWRHGTSSGGILRAFRLSSTTSRSAVRISVRQHVPRFASLTFTFESCWEVRTSPDPVVYAMWSCKASDTIKDCPETLRCSCLLVARAFLTQLPPFHPF